VEKLRSKKKGDEKDALINEPNLLDDEDGDNAYDGINPIRSSAKNSGRK